MKKAKNWCITRVMMAVEDEHLEEVLRLLGLCAADVVCAHDDVGQIYLGEVVNPAFEGTRQALLEQLKRTDDMLFDKREALHRAGELSALVITEVNVDYLYDPAAEGSEKFEYFCFGTDSFLLFVEAWGNWAPWDGLCWDTRRIGEQIREDMQDLSPDELRRFLDDDSQ